MEKKVYNTIMKNMEINKSAYEYSEFLINKYNFLSKQKSRVRDIRYTDIKYILVNNSLLCAIEDAKNTVNALNKVYVIMSNSDNLYSVTSYYEQVLRILENKKYEK